MARLAETPSALRAGPPDATGGSDLIALEAMLEATRGLLWITSASDAVVLATELVAALGGTTVAPDTGASDAIPVDLSCGNGYPLLPDAPRASQARRLLERYLPGFMRDAQRAVELAERTARLADDASIDPLTGPLDCIVRLSRSTRTSRVESR